MTRTIRIAAAALGVLVVPITLNAQQPAPSQDVQALMAELQEVQARLQPVQEQALEDAALQTEHQAVTAAVRQAIIAADAGMAAKLDRMEELMTDVRAAQAAGDAEKIAEITREAQTLEPEVRQAQAQALARPEIQERLELFQNNLSRRMIEIDPEVEPLIARRNELNTRLRAATSGA